MRCFHGLFPYIETAKGALEGSSFIQAVSPGSGFAYAEHVSRLRPLMALD